MNRQTINETYTLQIPDSFKLLGEEELTGMYRNVGEPFRWGVRDPENHVILLSMWKQAPALLSWVIDLKSLARKNERLTAGAHGEYGYRLLDFFSMQAGDEKAEGYRFSFDREGITQVSNNLLIRNGRMIYAFICVGREAHADADRELFRQIMGTLDYC